MRASDLTNQELKEKIAKGKVWLQAHEMESESNPPNALNGETYNLVLWEKNLNIYCALIDEAQKRDVCEKGAWLEMARAIFHDSNGRVSKWPTRGATKEATIRVDKTYKKSDN